MASTMDGTVRLVDGMTFEATSGSGHTLRIDVAPEAGGREEGARPLELLLLGLGGCTGMDVISILRKMRQDVTGYEVQVHGERAEQHPKVFTRITVEHVVRGHGLSEESVAKAVGLSEHKYCSANAMLGKVATIEHTYRLVEEPATADAAPVS